MKMLKIISANLLAEKPYNKYLSKNDVNQNLYLEIDFRYKLFVNTFSEHTADIYFFQEVDDFWKNTIIEQIVPNGYTLLLASCWSSSMAIVFKTAIFSDLKIEFVDGDAGIQAVSVLEGSSRLNFVNIHARWGNAKEYIKQYYNIFNSKEKLIIAGDFNIDKPSDKPQDNMNKEFFNDLIKLCNLNELTSEIEFTARSVNDASKFEKLDLILGKNLKLKNIEIHPKNILNLLPHKESLHFDKYDEKNHFSDHAMVLCEFLI